MQKSILSRSGLVFDDDDKILTNGWISIWNECDRLQIFISVTVICSDE